MSFNVLRGRISAIGFSSAIPRYRMLNVKSHREFSDKIEYNVFVAYHSSKFFKYKVKIGLFHDTPWSLAMSK